MVFNIAHATKSSISLTGTFEGFLQSFRQNMLSSIRNQRCWFWKAPVSKLTTVKLRFLRNNFTFTLIIKLKCYYKLFLKLKLSGRNCGGPLRRTSLGQNPAMLWFIISDDFCCSVKWGTFGEKCFSWSFRLLCRVLHRPVLLCPTTSVHQTWLALQPCKTFPSTHNT